MAFYRYEDEEVKVQTVPKRIYLMLDGKKHYIDPEIVKKYNLENAEESFFSGRKLYKEKG